LLALVVGLGAAGRGRHRVLLWQRRSSSDHTPIPRQTNPQNPFSAIIVALGPLNPLAQAVEAFRHWLERDRSRSLEITWRDDDTTTRAVRISGTAVRSADFSKLVEAARERFGKNE
jgi:hypothetical protein